MIKWKRKVCGNAPIQAEGQFLGHYFYFRARGKQATIDFSKTETDWDYGRCVAEYVLFNTEEEYAAGWLPRWICRILIWKGCLKFIFNKNRWKHEEK